jgi:ketosteroid isomerase-like protein
MTDEYAIQETINLYTEGASRSDWAQVMSTFTPDGAWVVPAQNARFEGHEAMLAAMSGFASQTEYWVQINSPAIIHVDGDKATARSIIRESGRFKGADSILEVVGFYKDELVRTADGWKFKQRTFETAGMYNLPLVTVQLPPLE